MAKQASKWFVPVAGLFVIAMQPAHAQAPAAGTSAAAAITLPAGATMWRYECTPGTQCPTRCAAGPTEVFQTANYASIVIIEFPNRSIWLRVDTGKGNVDYVGAANSLLCSVNGATLVSATTTDKPTELPLSK